MTIHYSHTQLFALAGFLWPLEVGQMRVRKLKNGKYSVQFTPKYAWWFAVNYFRDLRKPSSDLQDTIVSETFDILNQKFQFI